MDNTTEQLDKSLNAFFEHPAMKVAAIKGQWGIGKTYFWNKYIAEYIESADCKYQAYSYVSLFNNKDINEIKQQVLYSVKPIKIEIEKSILHKCRHQITNFMKPKLNKIKSVANQAAKIPYIGKYVHLILGLGYLLQKKVNNYIICIDDIERKHKSITMDALLGFIDDLAQHKSCKVVLIFNEYGIAAGNLKTLTKYREKVIDIEVVYLPTFKDSLEIALDKQIDDSDELLNIITILEITNIRVLRKINWAIQEVSKLKEFKKLPDSEQSHLIRQIALLCWSYYNAENCPLPFEVIEQNICDVNLHNMMLLTTSEHQDNNNSEELANKTIYRNILQKMDIYPRLYSKELIYLLKNGYIDHDSLKYSMDTIVEEMEKQKAEQNLWQIWDNMYSDTFKNNAYDIINEFEKFLDKEELGKIRLTDFSKTINFIEKFTKKDTYDKKIDNYIDRYIVSFNSKSRIYYR